MLRIMCALLSIGLLQAGTGIPKDLDPKKDEERVYQLGNSHTDSIREELAGLVGAAGHLSYAYGTHTIPGAPLRWLASHPNESFEHLRQHSWTVVTLQTYNSTTEEEIQAAIDYSAAAKEGNPDVTILMYTIWPQDENWDQPSMGRSEEWTETVAGRIRQTHPDLNVIVAPTSLMIRKLGNLADAGLVPGMNSKRDLYADPGHMGRLGAYAINCVIAAMIYQESPIGYPSKVLKTRGYRPDPDNVRFEIDPVTATTIQHLAWDVLAAYPEAGVDTGMVINSGRLSAGLVGRPYEQALPVVNASGPVQWSLVEGELPTGLQLVDGRITGTATEAVESTLVLRAQAGGEQVERSVRLPIDEDRPLAVPDQALPSLRAHDYLMHQWRAEGAVGRSTWRLAQGSLPAGLKMTDGGLLLGTPGEAGTFTFSLEATDQHPAGARTAQREISWQVAPAGDEVLRVRTVPVKLERKQPLAEQDLSPFEPRHDLVDENGNKVGSFDITWIRDPKKYKNSQVQLVAWIEPPQAGSTIPRESVHVYLDMMHNREIIYNTDDLHFMVELEKDKEGRAEVVQGYKRCNYLLDMHDDGSATIAFVFTGKMFAGRGVHTQLGPKITYGFNIAIGSAQDAAQRIYWAGDAAVDADTSGFGSILITE